MSQKLGTNLVLIFSAILLLITFTYVNYNPFHSGNYNILDFFISLVYILAWGFFLLIAKRSKDIKCLYIFALWWSMQAMGLFAYLLLPLFQTVQNINTFPYQFYPFIAPMIGFEFLFRIEGLTICILIIILLFFVFLSLLFRKLSKKEIAEMEAMKNAKPLRKRKYGYIEE